MAPGNPFDTLPPEIVEEIFSPSLDGCVSSYIPLSLCCKRFDGLLRSPYIISKMCIPIAHVLDPSPTSNHSGTRLSVTGSINGICRRYSWISLYCKHCTARVAPMTVRLRQAMKAVMVNMPSGRFPQDMVMIEPTQLLFKSRLFLPNSTSI